MQKHGELRDEVYKLCEVPVRFIPLLSFFFFFFSLHLRVFPVGEYGCGQAMPHCWELALAQVQCSSIIGRRFVMPPASDATCFPADQSAKPTPTFPRTIPCELPLRCKVTDPFSRVEKK